MVLDWALFFKTMRYFATFELSLYSGFNLIALLFAFSNLNAVHFAVAHEIFHKPNKLDRIVGTLHMSKNLYMHFTYEHVFGHHRRVATPEDPASARKGENLYKFVVRSFFCSYKSVYDMEKEAGKPFLLNYCVLSIAAAIGFTSLIFAYYPIQAAILFVIEAYYSIFYLEAINYI